MEQKWPVEIDIKGMERFMTLSDRLGVKCAGFSFLSGDMKLLELSLPLSVMKVVNTHPRLRAIQVKGVFAKAQVQPPVLEVEEISKYLEIIHVEQKEIQKEDRFWLEYVQKECEKPIDRFNGFPFAVHVFLSSKTAILIVFSDHYVCDGTSLFILMNDLLENITSSSSKLDVSPPCPASLFDQWIVPLLPSLTSDESKENIENLAYKSFLTLRQDLQPFTHANPPNNTTEFQYGIGTKENLERLISRCKEEKVTVTGAIMAGVLLGYAKTKYQTLEKLIMEEKKTLKLFLEVDVNMRGRISDPFPKKTIGDYATVVYPESFSKKGINIEDNFWVVARKVKEEIDALANGTENALNVIHMHEDLNSSCTDPTVNVPSGIFCDVAVSSMGKYPFNTRHEMEASSNDSTKFSTNFLQVHETCIFNAIPFYSAACMIGVCSVEYMSYTVMHKYESVKGKELLKWIVKSIENVGNITPTMSMIDAFQQLS
jgi:hypothetical protein